MLDLCISSRSSPPKAGVSFLLSSSRFFCRVMRVASEIRLLVLVHTSVVVEWEANILALPPPDLMPTVFAVGPGYYL